MGGREVADDGANSLSVKTFQLVQFLTFKKGNHHKEA